MAALTRNKSRATKAHERRLNMVPANAGEKFYNGAYILREAASAVGTNAVAAGNVPLGVLVEPLLPSDPDKAQNHHLDNTDGADGVFYADGTGDRLLRYDTVGDYPFAVTGGTPKAGDPAYLVDNATVTPAVTATGIKAGVFSRPSPTGTGEWFVDIGKRGGAGAPLTDNSGGATGNNTIAVIPDPADAPASADALREDLVANVLPPIRDAIADLTAKVNALLAAQ
jgi:hypothetical protein